MYLLCLSIIAVCGMEFLQRLGDVHADLVCVQLKPQDGHPTPVPALVRQRGKRRDEARHPVKVSLRRRRLALSTGVTVIRVRNFSRKRELDVDQLTYVEASHATKMDSVYTEWTGDLSC